MDKVEFAAIRHKLAKTQQELAGLLGGSVKAIHSYEQGWRKIPGHAERQLLFLRSQSLDGEKGRKSCWIIKKCSVEVRRKCPAFEFKAGKLCWFINGTICEGEARLNWSEKMKICRSCEVFTPLTAV